MKLSSAIIFISIFGLSACNQETDIVQKHSLASGEEKIFEIKTDKPMFVGFGFELGTDSWKAASKCPEIEGTIKDFMIKVCGGIYNLDNEGNKILAQNGGGMSFTPKDGKLRIKLVNFAKRSMDFELKIKDVE